jgi:hypothetical protein
VKLLGPFLLLSALATAGCFVPSPVVRLSPETPDVIWRDGRGVMTREGPGYRVAVAFDHQVGRKLAMRLEVQNTGADRFDVDPAEMSVVTCQTPQVCSAPFAILDPERALIALDEARAREEASQKNDAALGTALVLLDVTAGVAAAASGKPAEAAGFVADSAEVGASTNAALAGHDATLGRLEQQRASWAAVALRRSTVLPGEQLSGFLYLPLDSYAVRVFLRVGLGGPEIWFPFRQEVVSARRRVRRGVRPAIADSTP